MIKKLFPAIFILFLCVASFAQGTVMRGIMSVGNNSNNGVAYSVGQTFGQHAPDADSVPLVAEGIQQGYTTVVRDTMLLLSDEMGSYTAGANTIRTTTYEGYDATIYRQVYEMTCLGDFVFQTPVSGHETYPVTIPEPQILPAGSAYSDGPVVLLLDRANSYDYLVGDTTQVLWTASVAGQSKVCRPNVFLDYFNCGSTVADIDGHSYPIVRLGYYCWTGKNMRTLRYADRSAVPNVMTYPASYAPGVTDVVDTYGHLYTWNAATNYNIVGTQMQGICPDGWHIPSETEMEYLLAIADAPELMSSGWIPDIGTDDYGFSFLPAGYYNANLGRYEGLGVRAYFWTAEVGGTIYHACEFGSACGTIEIVPTSQLNGFSVRCVLDY